MPDLVTVTSLAYVSTLETREGMFEQLGKDIQRYAI